MIRDIAPEDRAAFISMMKRLYASKAVTHNVDDSVFAAAFDTALGKSPYLRALIIEVDGRPSGYALLSFSYATETGGLAVLLEDLYLDETCRGKGLGGGFLRFMESEYPSAKRYRLEVTKANTKAIELYRRHGYEILDYVQMVKDNQP